MEQKSNKTIVRECYRKIIRDLDLSLVDGYIKEDYIQHSPTIKDGRAGILEMLNFLKTLPKPPRETPSPIVRMIGEGDLVAVHLDIKFMGKRMAVIDMFRLENGFIAEHWDAGQPQTGLEDAVVTMTNGMVTIDETADARANKTLINAFYKDVFEQQIPGVADKFLDPDYIEHNAQQGLLVHASSFVNMHRIIADGDFVVTQCEYAMSDKTFASYHIFRCANGKIAEHWSVEQEVPVVMAHSNGMF